MSRPLYTLLLAVMLLSFASTVHAQRPLFSISTSTGNDTLFVGQQGSIIFSVEAFGVGPLAVEFPLQVSFTNGNIMGPVIDGESFHFSAVTDSCFNYTSFDTTQGLSATDPDTLAWYAIQPGDGACWWAEPVEIARITFAPTGPGTLLIDSIDYNNSHLAIHDGSAHWIDIDWESRPVTVIEPCPHTLTGDINKDGVITSADIIYMVSCIFKDCLGTCFARGDVNCSGTLTSADIIYLVGYVFKGNEPPCDVCTIWGRWVHSDWTDCW